MKEPNYTNPYFDKAQQLEEDGKDQEALEYYKKAIADATCPNKLKAESFLASANILKNQGVFEEAQAYLEKLEEFTLDNQQIGQKYIVLCDLCTKLGKSDEAYNYLKLAEKHNEAHLPECKVLLATTLMKKSPYIGGEERINTLLRAFDLLKGTTDQQSRQIFCSGMLCIAYQTDEKESEKWFKTGFDIYIQNPDKYIAWYFRLLIWQTYVYMINNEYAKGIENCLECEQIYLADKEGKIAQADVPYMYYNLAGCFLEKGDFFEAIIYAQKTIHLNPDQKRSAILSMHTLTQAYSEIGEYMLAQKYAEQAFEWFKEADPNWNISKHNSYLSLVYLNLGEAYKYTDVNKSTTYFLKAIEVFDRAHDDPNNPEYLESILGLAMVNLNEKGITYVQRVLSNHSSKNYFGYYALGNIQMALEKTKKAITAYLNFLTHNLVEKTVFDLNNKTQKQQFREYKSGKIVLSKLGTAYLTLYQREENTVYLEKALKSFNYAFDLAALLKKGIDQRSQIMVNNQLPNEYAPYIEALMEIKTVDYKRIIELFEVCKGSILSQSMMAKQVQKKHANLPLIQEDKERKNQLIKLEQAWEQAKEEEKKAVLYEQFFKERRAYQVFLQTLAKEQSDYYKERYQVEEINIDVIQESLKDNQKILSYLLTDEKIFILFIDNEEVVLEILRKPKDFNQLVTDFFQAINSYDKQTYEEKARRLYTLLIERVEDLLQDLFGDIGIQDLNIIPHGILNQLPFEALFSKKEDNSPQYLLYKFNISYHYSLDLFVKSQQKSSEECALSFLGLAPIYKKEKSTTWSALPFSEEEVIGIAQLFEKRAKKSQTYFHEAANKANLLKEIGKHAFVHIAAHYHQHEIPQHSGLVLSNGSYLFVDDAYTLDLQARLIVLSACESGIGKISKSEGMMAISRGFLYAGAQNIVSTLYEINDELASKLMQLFYQNILEGQPIKEALNQAKRTFIQSNQAPEKIWAAFILIQ